MVKKNEILPDFKRTIPTVHIDPVIGSVTQVTIKQLERLLNRPTDGLIVMDQMHFEHINPIMATLHRFLTYETMMRHENFHVLSPAMQRSVTDTWQQIMETLLEKMSVFTDVVNSK